jgi:hypothetical protein
VYTGAVLDFVVVQKRVKPLIIMVCAFAKGACGLKPASRVRIPPSPPIINELQRFSWFGLKAENCHESLKLSRVITGALDALVPAAGRRMRLVGLQGVWREARRDAGETWGGEDHCVKPCQDAKSPEGT